MDKTQISVEKYKARKWKKIFNFMDKKGDAILDKDEFMTFPQGLLQSGSIMSGKQLTKLYEEYWRVMKEALRKDHTNDSFRVDEWIEATNIVSSTTWYREDFVPAVAQVYFESVDMNHDGSISVDEWRKYQNTRGMFDESVIVFTFHKLDKDGDGIINPEELRYGILQFGIGEDPSDDYSFLFTTEPDM